MIVKGIWTKKIIKKTPIVMEFEKVIIVGGSNNLRMTFQKIL